MPSSHSLPQKSFFRSPLKIIIGIILLLTYYEWIKTVLANSNNELSRNLHPINPCPHTETNRPELPQDIENQLNHKIKIIDNRPTYDSDTFLVAQDTKHIIESIKHLYHSSQHNRCKIESLLAWDEFQILLIDPVTYSSHHELQGAYASYVVFEKAIYVPMGCTRVNIEKLTQLFSHEMKHALDVLDNAAKNEWFREFTVPDQMGNPKCYRFFEPRNYEQRKHISHLTKIIEQDLSLVHELNNILDKPSSQRLASEASKVSVFITLIRESNYQQTFIARGLLDNEEKELKFKMRFFQKDYACDKQMKKCWLKQKPFTMFPEEFHLLEHDKKDPNNNLYSPTDPNDCSDENLAKNLIKNILARHMKVPRMYPEALHAPEFGAHFDEILGQYPKLMKYLFPAFSEYAWNRTTAERQACLKR